MLDGEMEEAIASVQKAVALDPNGADAELNLAIVLTYAGQNPEALAAMDRVLQLNPKPPAQVYVYYGLVLYMNRRYEEAIKALGAIQTGEQSDLGFEILAMANARLGRVTEAHKAVEAILKSTPGQSLANLRVVYGHHRRKEDLDHRLNALRDAGVPDWCFGFHGRLQDRLGTAAIRNLALNKTWVGRARAAIRDGKTAEIPFVMELSTSGDFAQRAQGAMIVGKFTFEDDLFCTQSSATLLGRRFCSPIFRNPGGSSEKQNEYVFPDSATVWYFSVTE
jgi:tetratricopeptide (TPR) repeat protein